ncbi:MAG: HAD family hydrolase [bacterium]|nr:HAD family hydrolase [bacterium]
MKVYPEQTGPMAHWESVAPVEGIAAALENLKNKYQIVLVSNARDSDRSLVRKALERVHLSQYFHEVFTPHEVYEHKPCPNFYLKILKQIEVEPENAIMVGDSYEGDIIAAKQVGLWTVWYNPDRKQLHNEAFPYHDVELNRMLELHLVVQKKMKFR